jgi:hypothetical protein
MAAFRSSGDSRVILDPRAVAVAKKVFDTLRPPDLRPPVRPSVLRRLRVLGAFHWARCRLLPPGRDQLDRKQAILFYSTVYEYDPDAVPTPVIDLIAQGQRQRPRAAGGPGRPERPRRPEGPRRLEGPRRRPECLRGLAGLKGPRDLEDLRDLAGPEGLKDPECLRGQAGLRDPAGLGDLKGPEGLRGLTDLRGLAELDGLTDPDLGGLPATIQPPSTPAPSRS